MHHTPNLSYCEVYLQDRITDLSLTNVHLLKLNRFHLNINVNWLIEDFSPLFSITPHVKHLNLTFI